VSGAKDRAAGQPTLAQSTPFAPLPTRWRIYPALATLGTSRPGSRGPKCSSFEHAKWPRIGFNKTQGLNILKWNQETKSLISRMKPMLLMQEITYAPITNSTEETWLSTSSKGSIHSSQTQWSIRRGFRPKRYL
jgi:hypothetical protein